MKAGLTKMLGGPWKGSNRWVAFWEVAVLFEPRDLWVGVYWDPRTKERRTYATMIYLVLIPTIALRVYIQPKPARDQTPMDPGRSRRLAPESVVVSRGFMRAQSRRPFDETPQRQP